MSINDTDCQNYLNNGYLYGSLSIDFSIAQVRIESGRDSTANWSQVRQRAFEKWETDMKTIETMLNSVAEDESRETSDIYEQRVSIPNTNLTYWRGDYLGKHLISIETADTPDNDSVMYKNFWTISVAYNGDFWKDENNVLVTKFYHFGTNMNVDEMRNALSQTKHLFPKAHAEDPLRMSEHQLTHYLCQKINGCYVCGDKDPMGYTKCKECWGFKCRYCSKVNDVHWDSNGLIDQWKQAQQSADEMRNKKKRLIVDNYGCENADDVDVHDNVDVCDDVANNVQNDNNKVILVVEDDDKTCMVCLDALPDTTVLPCMHCVVCANCSEGLKATNDRKTCVQCRREITDIFYPDNTIVNL